MELTTALMLAFQLLAFFSIAGALVIYLICKVRNGSSRNQDESQPSVVLITSADTALGLQLCTHLAKKGCRVLAGMKEVRDSLPAKLLDGWLRMREYAEEPVRGVIIPIPLDVTREDLLQEATVAIGAHLNAGELGIAAVINTSGSLFQGHVQTQEVHQWEHMLKTNILGSLRVAKAFVRFLRHTRGRLIYLGAGSEGDGLVAFCASRVAVEKCAEELRKELQPVGVSVVALDTSGVAAESLYKAPMPQTVSDGEGKRIQYTADVLTSHSLRVIERALWDASPKERYKLSPPSRKYNFTLPCRSTLCTTRFTSGIRGVEKV